MRPFSVVEVRGEPVVRLEPGLARALEREYPEYRLPTPAEEDPQLRALCRERHPDSRVTYAAMGAFEGKGRMDAVLRLRGRRSRFAVKVVVFHPRGDGGYRSYVLDLGRKTAGSFWVARWPPGPLEYVRYAGDEILPTPGRMRLRHDGIEITEPESASRVYFWEGSRYRHVQTHD